MVAIEIERIGSVKRDVSNCICYHLCLVLYSMKYSCMRDMFCLFAGRGEIFIRYFIMIVDSIKVYKLLLFVFVRKYIQTYGTMF